MDTEKYLPRRHSKRHIAIRAAALAALCALAPVASAEPPAAPAVETRAARVSLAGLDLSTPEGARAARTRLKKMAQRLCRHFGDDLRASNRVTMNACVRETLADAVRQIDSPVLPASPRLVERAEN
jgi:UrcA family protein